ncbi:twin-arginine translocation signal domain-containing protein [Halobaculum litoreum]|uniref:twin-arginine translocation signal domain-containing protein n=1 Tax=Halobaculum litoreum TaxID=3031998 RepID=UPI003D811C87
MTAKRGADAPTTDGESDGTTLADRRTFIKGVGATAATLATAGARAPKRRQPRTDRSGRRDATASRGPRTTSKTRTSRRGR